jgi:hypothetical protein
MSLRVIAGGALQTIVIVVGSLLLLGMLLLVPWWVANLLGWIVGKVLLTLLG